MDRIPIHISWKTDTCGLGTALPACCIMDLHSRLWIGKTAGTGLAGTTGILDGAIRIAIGIEIFITGIFSCIVF